MSLLNQDALASSLPHHPSKNPSQGISGPQPAMAQQPPTPAEAENTPEGWARIEAEWYRDRQRARDLEDSSMADKYERRMAPLRENHTRLLDERQRLHEMLLAVKKQCDEADDEINRMDLHYFEAKEIVAKRRQQQDENAILFFTRNKNEALRLAGRADEMVPEVVPVAEQLSSSGSDTAHSKAAHGISQVGTPGSDDTAVDDPVRTGHAAIHSSGPPSSESSPLSQPPDDEAELTGAEIQTHDGQLITRVKHINLENRYVRNILQVPIQRAIKLRPGRKFVQETVDSIYEPSDTKGAKWISCMIQATGEEQDVPCTSCQSRAGTWVGCVIVGGEDFPRCANCEWNRQGCAGSSYHLCRSRDPDLRSASRDQAPMSPLPPAVQDAGETTSREGSTSGGFTPVNGAQARTALPTSLPSSAPPKRTSLPTKKGGRKSLPNMASSGKQNAHGKDDLAAAGNDAEAAAEASEDGAEPDPGPTITKHSLHLKHDGVVYTEPEIMRGVPVERISPTHPYWDDKWDEVRPALDIKFNDWQNKLNVCLTTGKNRFLAGRQVNRGKTIMRFFDTADFHPYQLVSKKFITKSLVSYDTIFRLAQVIEELPKVHEKLGIEDVSPLDWVRERMHELYMEQGDAFSLARTVHELYHDPKLRALRTTAGFGNIGRPSGVKKGMTSKGGAIRHKDAEDMTPMPTPSKLSRPSSSGSTKSGHSVMQENKRDYREDGLNPSPRSVKKQRVDMGNLPTPDGEQPRQFLQPLNVSSASASNDFVDHQRKGQASTDSASANKLTNSSWRIMQLRTVKHATDPTRIQYWRWNCDDGNPRFQHQVLRDVEPSVWGTYNDSTDFDLRLAEIKKVQYFSDDDYDKIIVTTNPVLGVAFRGKLLVRFKRDGTAKSFSAFLTSLKSSMEEENRHMLMETVTKEYIETEWNSMAAKVIPMSEIDI